jgi:hypothetical protein
MGVTFTSIPMASQSEAEQLEARRGDLLLEIAKVDAALAALKPAADESAPEAVTDETPVAADTPKPRAKAKRA